MEQFNDVQQAVEQITPDAARALLEGNESNRSLRQQVVVKYARDMTAGRWHYLGDPIRVAEDGTLLDGQHRLSAIVRSGRSLPMMVIRGLDREAQAAIDTGARRTGADAVRLGGDANAPVLAAVARMILTNGDERVMQVSNAEISEVVSNDPHLRWVITKGVASLTLLRKRMTPAVLGYAYWRCHQVDAFAAAEFFDRLASLTDLPTGSPVLALNARLAALNARGGRAREYRLEALGATFNAWNAWRKGQTKSVVTARRLDGRIFLPDLI